jgi:hypothetical protein
VDINGHFSNTLNLTCGVFQGSILGPLLFLCYINDLFNATDLATYLFADDTTCLAEHKNLNELITFVNSELQKLAVWFKANKMAVNVKKTQYIIFRTRGKKIDTNGLDVVFNSNDLNTVNPDPSLIHKLDRVCDSNNDDNMKSFKLLGVYFDEYLSFNKHISILAAKLSRANFLLRRVSNFVSNNTMRKLYFSLFHSHLLYCSNIYSCTSLANINRISILQKKSIRIITRSGPYAHTEDLFLTNRVLTFENIISMNKLLFMHSIAYNYAPPSFDNTWQKNDIRGTGYNLRNDDFFILPLARIELFRKSPLYALPLAWNTLPEHIRYQHNRCTFKIALTDYLFENH